MIDDELNHYSRALDELYAVRVIIALELHTNRRMQMFATLPLTVRHLLMEQEGRLETALRRGGQVAARHLRAGEAQILLRRAGAKETLTRGAWESGSVFHA